MAARSVYLKLEQRIASDERGGVLHRWRYGRQLLAAKAGRKQLPHGMVADLVAEAARAGIKKLSEREIQRRIKCAEVYGSEQEVRQILADFGTWSALAEAGFPAVEVAGPDPAEPEVEPDDLENVGEPDPYTEVPLFDIPGFKPVLKVRGRKVELVGASVREAIGYRDMCGEMHTSFGRTVSQINESVGFMIAGCGGDLDANAVQAWRRGRVLAGLDEDVAA